jgi:acyl carrier protein
MNLQEDIRAFIVDIFLFGEEGCLKDESSFIEEDIMDSTGIMQLVVFLEERYLITIEDEELIRDNLDSIKKVATFIEEKRAAVSLSGAAE